LSSPLPPNPNTGNWQIWAERLNAFLTRTRDVLRNLTNGDSAAEDGVMMWDRSKGHMVISSNGAFLPVPYGENSYGFFADFNNQSATTVDTATVITWDTTAYSHNVRIDGSDSSKIVFDRGGVYELTFTAELFSSSSSAKTFYFWPRINGSDVANSTMVATLSANNEEKIASRSGIFEVNTNDYLQAMFAVSDLTASLATTAATAFCPASPSVTLSVSELYVP
jgi:hypothetical protein